ncbi:MAG: 7TM domain-containing protein, partial [Candidatus Moraniibacteriota bacterium]
MNEINFSVSPILTFFLSEGVPFETIKLILMLPIIATLIAFLRQVIGIKAFGIYTPLLVTFAFLATDGLRYGILIFVMIILIGMLMRIALKSFRLLYLPRVAIMLTIVALSILLMLAIGGSLKRTGLASVSIFPILIMITLVEKFIAVQIEKG